MATDKALLARDGVENLRHAVPDVVAHNVFDEQGRQQNTDNGINEEEPVGLRRIKL